MQQKRKIFLMFQGRVRDGERGKFHKIYKRENINILRAEDVGKTSMIVSRFAKEGKQVEREMICMPRSHATWLYLSGGAWGIIF
jgi:hypothetical protein